MASPDIPDDETLRVEYCATQDAYMHYDRFGWQAGAILFAGLFVLWGLLLASGGHHVEPTALGFMGCLVAAIMSAWILNVSHSRQIYLSKLQRIHEIEVQLGMQQHRRWVDGQPSTYRAFGPHGHHLYLVEFVAAGLGTSVIGLAWFGPSPWLALPLPIVVAVLLIVVRNESAIKNHLREVKAQAKAKHEDAL